MLDLNVACVELDEVWSFVRKKQKALTTEDVPPDSVRRAFENMVRLRDSNTRPPHYELLC